MSARWAIWGHIGLLFKSLEHSIFIKNQKLVETMTACYRDLWKSVQIRGVQHIWYQNCWTVDSGKKNILFLTNLDILMGYFPKTETIWTCAFGRWLCTRLCYCGWAPPSAWYHLYPNQTQVLFVWFCIVFLLFFTKSTSTISLAQKSRNAIWWPSECTRDSLEIKIFQGEQDPGPP